MSELYKIILTSAFTVIGGVLIFVLGKVFEDFIIEPIHAQRKAIAEIADALIFYANIYANPDKDLLDERRKVSRVLREGASSLMAKTHMIPGYRILSWIKLVLPYKNIAGATGELIGLSNNVICESERIQNAVEENNNRRSRIKQFLGVKY